MTITAILAVSINGVIGNKGKLPWHIPNEMKFFRETTMNGTLIMGRKTFESIGLLKGRDTIVISNTLKNVNEKLKVFNSVEAALDYCKLEKKENVFIIGGAELLKHSLKYCEYLFMSIIYEFFEGDTFLDYEKRIKDYKLIHKNLQIKTDSNEYMFSINKYQRIKN